LDALGWTKFFWDVRATLPRVPVPVPRLLFGGATLSANKKKQYTSAELHREFSSLLTSNSDSSNSEWHLPFGHTMLVANSKTDWYASLNSGGRPIMDWVARDLLHHIVWDDDVDKEE